MGEKGSDIGLKREKREREGVRGGERGRKEERNRGRKVERERE